MYQSQRWKFKAFKHNSFNLIGQLTIDKYDFEYTILRWNKLKKPTMGQNSFKHLAWRSNNIKHSAWDQNKSKHLILRWGNFIEAAQGLKYPIGQSYCLSN